MSARGTGLYRELPPDCLAWEHLMLGDVPFRRAQEEHRDEWVPVFVLTIGELIAVALGVRLTALDATPYAVRYDSVSERYLAYPLYRMPQCAGLPTEPEAWRDVWRPLAAWAVGPVIRASRTASNAIVVASDFLTTVADFVWVALRTVRRTA